MPSRGKGALDANRGRCALGAFTVYNIERAQAVTTAAGTLGMPVVIQSGSSGFRYPGENTLGLVAMTISQPAAGALGVHLVHSHSQIRERTSIPLVPHRASGLPTPDVAAAIEAGVAKVDIYAEAVRRAHIQARRECDETGDDLATFRGRGIAAAAAVVADQLRLFSRHQNRSEQS